jgi:iron(III) transport system permease protein
MRNTALRPCSSCKGSSQVLLLASLAVAILVGVPILGVLSNLFAGTNGDTGATFAHLWSTVLPEYVLNSLAIAVIVAMLAGVGGVGCAWLVAVFDFPGKRVFEWALVLPLAMPAYVVAYASMSSPTPTPISCSFPALSRQSYATHSDGRPGITGSLRSGR